MPKRGNWDGKSRGGRTGYSIFVWLLRHCGLTPAYVLLLFVVPYFVIFAPKGTKASWDYNRHRRGLGFFRSIWEVLAHFHAFGKNIIDRLAINAGLGDRFEFIYDDREKASELARLKGAMLLSAHVGCWEIGGHFFQSDSMTVNVVVFDNEHKDVKEVVDGVKSELPYKPINVLADPLQAMLDIRKALADGEFVCMNGERYIDEKSSIGKEFMGAACKLPSGPYRIAIKCRVPVIFFYAVREKGRKYRLIIEEAPAESRKDVASLTDAFLASLTAVLAKYPRQWFNFYDYWK